MNDRGGCGTENVTDLAITHLENMLDVRIQRRLWIDQRQRLIAHQISIGTVRSSRPGSVLPDAEPEAISRQPRHTLA